MLAIACCSDLLETIDFPGSEIIEIMLANFLLGREAFFAFWKLCRLATIPEWRVNEILPRTTLEAPAEIVPMRQLLRRMLSASLRGI